MIEKHIVLEDIDPVIFYGVNNVNMKMIQALYPKLKIVARGNVIKVLGDEEEMCAFEENILALEKHCAQYNSLKEEVILDIVKGRSPQIENTGDTIVFSVTGKPIVPRSENQLKLVQEYEKNDMLFAIGPAGSGKTYTAIALAVRSLKNKEIKKIILSRPAVEAGEKLGFLPGDMKDKIDPYLQPLYDALQDMILANRNNCGLWIAQYADMNPTWYQNTPWNEGAYTCAIRQYSGSGRLNGWNGDLDLDKFYGSLDDFRKYYGSSSSAPSKPSTSGPSGTTLQLATWTMEGQYGNGADRKKNLGSRYDEVQNFINHIASADVNTLVNEVYAGMYGDGLTRQTVLGSRYDEVQGAINANSAQYYTVQSGDNLGKIAIQFGTTVDQLVAWNNIANPDLIYAGQTIRVK